MSDFSIPGVSNKYNTNDAIQKLLEAERIPLKRMESEKEGFQTQKSSWLRLNQHMVSVRDSAKELYGFQNPFNEKIARSSDEGVLSAVAERSAGEEQVSIAVKQVAAPDRFISRSLPRDFSAPAGVYRFRVGEEEVKLTFPGGTLKALVDAINRQAGKLVQASLVYDTPSTQVVVIEGKKTGARNQLTFHDQAAAFGEQAGIIERSLEARRNVSLTPSAFEAWEKPLQPDGFAVKDGVLTLSPGTELKIPLRPPHTMSDNMVLAMEVRLRRIPEEAYQEPQPPPGPDIPPVGGIEFGGVRVQGAPSKTVVPPWEPPEPPKKVDDLQVLYVQGGGRTQALPALRDSEEFYTVEIPAGDLPRTLEALALRNRNTHRIVEVRDIRIYDVTARGDYKAVNPLSAAQDAVIVMDGIEVTRESNEIDDLLPGVNLTLHAPGAAELSVARDTEAITDALVGFIGHYNKLLMEVDILTRQDESILEGATYLSPEEKDQARETLGLLQGNITLMQMKSRLQQLMMNPYPTEGGREMALLAQIGITTSGGQFQTSGAIDRTRLRGYLQIDENKLKEAVGRNPDWVKQLFGFDTDRDLVVDSGIAYQIDGYLKSYVDTGGIVSNRVSAIDGSIARKSREIESYNRHLVDYERELRRKFGVMEGALDSLQQSSQAIENFNRRMEAP
jgi:flagellar hook-associated protein 2